MCSLPLRDAALRAAAQDEVTSVDGVLEGLAGLEAWHGRGGDLDLLAGLRIAALRRLAPRDLEGAEADQQDLLLLLQRLSDEAEDRIDGVLGIGLREIGRGSHGRNQIVLVHQRSPAKSGSVECKGDAKTASTLNTTFCA